MSGLFTRVKGVPCQFYPLLEVNPLKRKAKASSHHVANVRVEGSNPFARSNISKDLAKRLTSRVNEQVKQRAKLQKIGAELQRPSAVADPLQGQGGQAASKPIYIWEEGLGARIGAKGRITWQVHLRNRRRAFPSLEAALEAWETFQATTLPAHSQILTSEAPRGPSVDLFTLWRVYLAERGSKTRYWNDLDNRFKLHVLPTLTLSKAGIKAILETKQGYPVAQRTLWEALGPFMRWLYANDHINFNPMEALIPPRVPRSRDRVLTNSELLSIWNTSKREPLWGPYIQLLILTAQRRNEIAKIEYRETDLAKGEWVIPQHKTKNGKSHLVHLSPLAIQIIRSKPFFIGRNVSGFSKFKARIDRLSTVEDWRLHDLRRTAATGMASLGIAPHIIERVLNHYQGSVYQRFQYLGERRAALEAWAAYLTTIGIYL